MLKKLMRFAFVVSTFAFVLVIASGVGLQKVHATSADKFFIEGVFSDKPVNKIGVFFGTFNGGTVNYDNTIEFTPSASSQFSLSDQVTSQIVSWANSNGYTGVTSSDVYGYTPTGMKSVPEYWHNGAVQSSWKHLTFSGTTTSGTSVFYLTDDGTATGNALCSSTPKYVGMSTNDSGNTFGLAYAMTNSNKTLTVTANVRSFSATTILGISVLGTSSLTAATNGTAMNVVVDCN